MILRINSESDKRSVIDYVTKLNSDKHYTVEIKMKRKRRSIDQNSLYWLWLTCIMSETGESKETLHEFFKQSFLGSTEKWAFNKYQIMIPNSTTELDTRQMTYYLERVQQFASTELNIALPNPEDRHWNEFQSFYSQFI